MSLPATQSAMYTAPVIERRELASDVILLAVRTPQAAHATRPGQFAMVVPPEGEQAAVALGIYEAQGERISFLFFVCGRRTRRLASLREGDTLAFFGPLGNGFMLDSQAMDDVAILAGGVGIASVLLPARALRARGAQVRLYYGARTASRLVEAQRFREEGCEVHVATDDGSAGLHGYVSELLARVEKRPDVILACGPTPMLRATARVGEQLGVPVQLSLEETFACGVGGCWGCVVPLARTSSQAPSFPPIACGGSDVVHARICVEGPVFWAHELRW